MFSNISSHRWWCMGLLVCLMTSGCPQDEDPVDEKVDEKIDEKIDGKVDEEQDTLNCDDLSTAGLDPDEFVVDTVICLYNLHKNDDFKAKIDAFLTTDATAMSQVTSHQFEDQDTTLVMHPTDPDNEAFFEISLPTNDRSLFLEGLLRDEPIPTDTETFLSRKPPESELPAHVIDIRGPVPDDDISAVPQGGIATATACTQTIGDANEYYALGSSGVPLTPYGRGAAFFYGPAGLWENDTYDQGSLDFEKQLLRAFPQYQWQRNHNKTIIDENMTSQLVGYMKDPDIHTIFVVTHGVPAIGTFGFRGGIQVAAYTKPEWKANGKAELTQLRNIYGKKFVSHYKILEQKINKKKKKAVADRGILIHPGALFTMPPDGPSGAALDEQKGILAANYCHAGEFFDDLDYSSSFHVISGGSDEGVSIGSDFDMQRLADLSTWNSYHSILNRENRYLTQLLDQWSLKAELIPDLVTGGLPDLKKLINQAKSSAAGSKLLTWRVLRPEHDIPDMEAYPTIKSLEPTGKLGDFGTNGAKIASGMRISFSSLVEALDIDVELLNDGQSPVSKPNRIVVNVPKSCGQTAKAEWVQTYCLPSQTSGWQINISKVSLIHLPPPGSDEICKTANPKYAAAKAKIDDHASDLSSHPHYVTITIPGDDGDPLTAPNGIRFQGNETGDYTLDDYSEIPVMVNDVFPDTCLVQNWKYTSLPVHSDPVKLTGSGFRVHIPCSSTCTASALAPSGQQTQASSFANTGAAAATCSQLIREGVIPPNLPIDSEPILTTTKSRGYLVAEQSDTLWSTDGTLLGTKQITNTPIPQERTLENLAAVGSTLFFTSDNQLWRTDPTHTSDSAQDVALPPAQDADRHGLPGSLIAASDGNTDRLFFRYARTHLTQSGKEHIGTVIASVTPAGSVDIVLDPAIHQAASMGFYGVLYPFPGADPSLLFQGGCAAGFPCSGQSLRNRPWTLLGGLAQPVGSFSENSLISNPVITLTSGMFFTAPSKLSGKDHVLWFFDVGNNNNIQKVTGTETGSGKMIQFVRNQANVLFAHDSSKLYFVRIDEKSIRRITDTSPLSSNVIFASQNNKLPNQLTLVGDQLFFSVGTDIYVYDEKTSTPTLLGSTTMPPKYFIEVDGRVYFVVPATGGTANPFDDELWVADNSGIQPIRQQWSEYQKGDISPLARIGNTLVFFMREHLNDDPWELWRLPL